MGVTILADKYAPKPTTYGTAEASKALVVDSSSNIADIGTIGCGDITIGTDADGTDRAIIFGHSTLKSIMGIDDSNDAFVINTDAAFDATLADNSFSVDTGGNVIIGGMITMGGNDLTFGNGASIVHSDANTLTITEATTAFSAAVTAVGDITALTSDKRLKKDIVPIESPLDKLYTLSGFTYRWDTEKCKEAGFEPIDEEQIGVFAQDVQAVVPQAVKPAPFDADGKGGSKSGDNYLTVQYEKLVPLLIESIKEQQLQINSLQERIHLLEKNNE
jgi:hypothetical protein